jgi:uncharacterized protein YbaR (Trm112 family)
MSSLSEKYSKILSEIEEHISDPKESKYITQKIEEISAIYIELLDRLTKIDDDRISHIEEKQDKMTSNIARLQETLNLIKSDIYEDEDGYDFEIVCPYCNHEFVATVEEELKEEIECPECHNIIELDWDDDENCDSCSNKQCHSCNSEENKNQNQNQENNDDDM